MQEWETPLLRAAVAIGSVVPISAGTAGVLLGPRMMAGASNASGDLDSHFRYLSGLLLAIGLSYASTIPRIEQCGPLFRRLTFIVILGGLARLAAALASGQASCVTLAALVMELLVTPGLAVWQDRVARSRIATIRAASVT